jgi:hypothetical protein
VLLHDSDNTSPAGSWRAALAALPLLLAECERRMLRVGPLGEHGAAWYSAADRPMRAVLADMAAADRLSKQPPPQSSTQASR